MIRRKSKVIRLLSNDILRIQDVRDKNGGRAVRRADDRDGGGVVQVKVKQPRHAQREENAELGRRTNVMISSTRLINSGANDLFNAFCITLRENSASQYAICKSIEQILREE